MAAYRDKVDEMDKSFLSYDIKHVPKDEVSNEHGCHVIFWTSSLGRTALQLDPNLDKVSAAINSAKA
jgi:hypothetical protein